MHIVKVLILNIFRALLLQAMKSEKFYVFLVYIGVWAPLFAADLRRADLLSGQAVIAQQTLR